MTFEIKGHLLLKPLHNLFNDAVNYCQYRLIKKSACYDKDVAHELSQMTKQVATQNTKRNIWGQDLMLINIFTRS